MVRFLVKLVATLVGLAVLAIVVPWLVVTVESADRIYLDPSAIPARDVTLVMGAAVWDGQPSPYLKGRLDVAVELYRLGKTKVIIVSGSTSDNEPKTMRRYLVEHGVAASDIVLDEGGINSYASCARAGDKFGVHSLIAVSQTYHVPRAVATCRLVGVDAIAAADTTGNKDATWRSYERRELGANLKMLYDVTFRPDVGENPASDAVARALARHG